MLIIFTGSRSYGLFIIIYYSFLHITDGTFVRYFFVLPMIGESKQQERVNIGTRNKEMINEQYIILGAIGGL